MARTSSSQIFRPALLVSAFALAVSTFPALAVDYTWSPGGAPGVGSGIWSTSVANWTTSEDGEPVNWTSSTSNRAIFGGEGEGEYAVSVAGSYSIEGITINSSGYTLQSTVPATQRVLTHSGGGITIASGVTATFNQVRVNSNSNWGISGGGTLNLEAGGYVYSQQGLSIGADTTLVLDGGGSHAGNYTVNGTVTVRAGSIWSSTAAASNLGIRMNGNGTINLEGGLIQTVRFYNNTAVSTVLNLNSGTLQAKSGNASNFINVHNAYIKEGGVTIDSNGFNIITSQNLQHGGVAATDGGLTKAGDGALTLSGTSTYSGTTTINAGSLLVNGRLSNTASVIVNAAGTLGGSGSINAAVTVNGTLAPGASIETLITGEASFMGGSTLAVELDSSAGLNVAADLLVVNGNLDLNDEVTLTLTDIAEVPVAFAGGTTFSLVNYSGEWNSGLFTIDGNVIANGGTFALGLNTWQLEYDATVGGSNFLGDHLPDSLFVNIVAVVPEPSAFALLTGGLCATMFFRRHRRQLS
jgi:fibronectin-binding autotransporter adhesin